LGLDYLVIAVSRASRLFCQDETGGRSRRRDSLVHWLSSVFSGARFLGYGQLHNRIIC
jgi:hypothetical protein